MPNSLDIALDANQQLSQQAGELISLRLVQAIDEGGAIGYVGPTSFGNACDTGLGQGHRHAASVLLRFFPLN